MREAEIRVGDIGETSRGVFPGDLGGGVRPAAGNPTLISDQNMRFPFPISDVTPKFHTLFQTRPLPSLPYFVCLNI